MRCLCINNEWRIILDAQQQKKVHCIAWNEQRQAIVMLFELWINFDTQFVWTRSVRCGLVTDKYNRFKLGQSAVGL